MKRKAIKMLAMVVIVPALFSLVLMLLWNASIPDIVGLPSITYLQALCLYIIGRILFGGFGLMVMGGLLHMAFHARHGNPKRFSREEAREMLERRWRRPDAGRTDARGGDETVHES